MKKFANVQSKVTIQTTGTTIDTHETSMMKRPSTAGSRRPMSSAPISVAFGSTYQMPSHRNADINEDKENSTIFLN